MHRAGSPIARAFPRTSDHCEPRQLRPYPLCSDLEYSRASHVHHAVDKYASISTPVGEHQGFEARASDSELPVIRDGGMDDLARVNARGAWGSSC